MADKKFSTKRFGDTYYPISQNAMQKTRFTKFTGNEESKKKSLDRDALDKFHNELKEKLYKENVRPSEIKKLDKEYKARMKRANDDLQYRLSNRAGMKEERKKQKGTIPDTGSAFSIGGEMLKGGQKKLKGKPGAGSIFIQLKSLKSLLGLKNGGDTMLKGGQKKLDKNKDGKISGEDFKMMKKVAGGAAIKGMGAARTSGMGLQDEQLPPGKSLDYYKDIM